MEEFKFYCIDPETFAENINDHTLQDVVANRVEQQYQTNVKEHEEALSELAALVKREFLSAAKKGKPIQTGILMRAGMPFPNTPAVKAKYPRELPRITQGLPEWVTEVGLRFDLHRNEGFITKYLATAHQLTVRVCTVWVGWRGIRVEFGKSTPVPTSPPEVVQNIPREWSRDQDSPGICSYPLLALGRYGVIIQWAGGR